MIFVWSIILLPTVIIIYLLIKSANMTARTLQKRQSKPKDNSRKWEIDIPSIKHKPEDKDKS